MRFLSPAAQGKVKALAAAARLRAGAPGGGGALPELLPADLLLPAAGCRQQAVPSAPAPHLARAHPAPPARLASLMCPVPQVEAGALDQMYGILSQYTEALGKLSEVLRRAERDVGILEAAASERG